MCLGSQISVESEGNIATLLTSAPQVLEPPTRSMYCMAHNGHTEGLQACLSACCSVSGYWSLTSWQHLRLHQDAHRLLTVRNHGNSIVMPYGKTRPDNQMSRASVSCFRRSGGSNLMGLNPGCVKPMT